MTKVERIEFDGFVIEVSSSEIGRHFYSIFQDNIAITDCQFLSGFARSQEMAVEKAKTQILTRKYL